jgi:hypothetical protein
MAWESPSTTLARRAWPVRSSPPPGGSAASPRSSLANGDTDHRGAAPALRAYADVLCHPDAVGQAQGSGGRDNWRTGELPLDVRLLHGFSHRFVWDGGPVHIDGTVEEGDVIAVFEVIDLPGHAPGLIGLWRARDRVALEKVSGVGSTLSESTPDSGDVKHGARKAAGIAQENPLGLALGAIALGFVGGLLVPSTQMEDEKLGPMADQVKDKAKETGQEAVERGKEVVQQSAQSAKETAQEAGREHVEGLRESAQQKAVETRQQAGSTT